MSKPTKNMAGSVRDRLKALSRERGEDFHLILTRYGLERLLYRLGRSEYAERFVLKGAMLFALWTETVHRPTKDLDLLGYGDVSAPELRTLFERICQVEVEPDGIVFEPNSIRVEDIREDQEYQGRRVKLNGKLGQAKIDLQLDIGFGDVITPEAQEIEYPTLLELPPPRIRAYPKESVVSEKLQAMVFLGMVNSRMKDFYDLWVMSRKFSFAGETLTKAIKATFERRKTAIPEEIPPALSQEFTRDRNKAAQWQAFLNRTGLSDEGKGLPGVIEDLRIFLEPLLVAAKGGRFTFSVWTPEGKWQARKKPVSEQYILSGSED
ncbi:MAG: nucleotidyl transferase AbiEii/AbiGii toxin family protein [Deltaproteobacteria bacterium]|nr:nucleotidyl transferase AbiEii/AbiGii toxin family protein [Deltaproteobacteria bacterium]